MKVRTAIAALIVAASVLLVPAQAQADAADKGSFFVSGQLGLNYYFKSSSPEDSEDKKLDLLFAPRVLYFPARSIGVGGEANLSMDFNYSDHTNLAIGPRFAYYLIKPEANRHDRGCCMNPWFGDGSRCMPFVGVSAMYLNDRTSHSSGGSTTSSGYRVRAGLGMAPMIGDRGTAFLELGFQTQSLKRGELPSETSNKLYLEGGFGAFLFR